MSDSLPQRMREAAKVLREVSAREGCAAEYSWPPNLIEVRADRWEVEDDAAAEREAMAEELAHSLLIIQAQRYPDRGDLLDLNCTKARDDARNLARKLIAAGWTKQVRS